MGHRHWRVDLLSLIQKLDGLTGKTGHQFGKNISEGGEGLRPDSLVGLSGSQKAPKGSKRIQIGFRLPWPWPGLHALESDTTGDHP